ncbi:MAG: thioredoxin family protein [Alphaproteobacteria bacterium]
MALLHTPSYDEALIAPDFTLKNIDGNTLSLGDIKGEKGTLVMFICNHCPYVKAIIERLAETCKTLQAEGIGCAAIMPNDTENYPADSFENMQKFAREHNFTFPYLIDETQETAKAYGAICTPDLFGFNKDLQLQYRGRLDSAGINPPDTNTAPELLLAMRRIADIGAGPHKQMASMGCSIKWKS